MKVYDKIIEEMGEQKFYQGYSTSSSDSEEERELKELQNNKKQASDDENEVNANGEKVKVERTPQELYDIELEDAIEIRPYVIEANSIYRVYWDFLIIIAAICNSILLPFDIAFPEDMQHFAFVSVLDSIMMYIFIIDVILGFNTSYINI